MRVVGTLLLLSADKQFTTTARLLYVFLLEEYIIVYLETLLRTSTVVRAAI